MSLYLTSVSLQGKKHIDEIQLNKTKDAFISYLIKNEAEFANMGSIEEHLVLSTTQLRERLDRLNSVLDAKRDELSELMLIITTMIKEHYQIDAKKYSDQSQCDEILQLKEVIRVKEHDIFVYHQMKSRLTSFNISLKHRIETELKYQHKIETQHMTYRLINNTITRDYMHQRQMYHSLSKESNYNKRQYARRSLSNSKRLERAQLALDESKEDLEKQRKAYRQLKSQCEKIRSLLKSTVSYNERLKQECKQCRREYCLNRRKVYFINLILSSKRLSDIVPTVKKDQFDRDQMFSEFLYLNRDISNASNQKAKFDSLLMAIQRDLIAKNSNEYYLSNEYSDKRVFNNEIRKKTRTFSHSEMLSQCVHKEALLEGIIYSLMRIKKKFIENSLQRTEFNSSHHISIMEHPAPLALSNSIVKEYVVASQKMLQLFSSLAFNILMVTSNTLNTLVLLKARGKDYHNNNHHERVIIPFTNDLLPNHSDRAVSQTHFASKTRISTRKSYLIPYNTKQPNGNVVPLSAKQKEKSKHDLLLNFKKYLEIKKDRNSSACLKEYPRQVVGAISPFYWDMSNDPTLSSSKSTLNVTSAKSRTAGFSKRMAYDPFSYKRNMNEQRKFMAHSAFKSENEVNDNSYDESNRFSIKQDSQNEEKVKRIRYQDDSERGQINLRLKELYQFAFDNNAQRKTSHQLLLSSYRSNRLKANNDQFKVKSAYAISSLSAYPGVKRSKNASAISTKRRIGIESAFKRTTSFFNSKSPSQSKFNSFHSTARDNSGFISLRNQRKHQKKINFCFQTKDN